MRWKMARDALGSPELGVSRFTCEPGARMPFGHRHREQEESYVAAGSGHAELDDELVELVEWDVLRVAPAVDAVTRPPPGRSRPHLHRRPQPKGSDTERIADFWN